MNFAPEQIGVGRYSGELAQYLAAAGHDVLAVTAPPHYPDWTVAPPHSGTRYTSARDGPVQVIRCPILLPSRMGGVRRLLPPLTFALFSAPAVLWQILRRRPDCVLFVEPTLFSVPIGLLAAKLVGARTVLHVQDLEIDAAFAVGHLRGDRLRRLAGRLEGALMRRCDRVVAISRKMRERIVAKGVPPAAVTLIRNWVDLSRIAPLGRPSRYRTELGFADDAFVVLYAGSIGSKQALEVVLDAAQALADLPRVKFVIAGGGPAAARLAARYGALPNVRFMPLQPEERLCELLGLADLHVLPQQAGIADLVLPSKLGGMLASGKPVLVTAEPGTELHEFLSGVATLVPAGDSAAVAREIRRLAVRDAPSAGRERELASVLSSATCLPAFERLLTGRDEGGVAGAS
ncbi:MAG: Colanic acid biosynthesis glycosyltransferase WcaI [Enterovirga sp.]|nr:Colanic acid biosynthesis glycosyltransferase WcaI [Enterovirga sp.]